MIPHNAEHHEALQQEANNKRQEFFAAQSPQVQEKISKIESLVKEFESLEVPFSLNINPFGWEWDDANKKSYWWFGKFHKGEPYSEEANKTIIEAKSNWVCSAFGHMNNTEPYLAYVVSIINMKDKSIVAQVVPDKLKK